LLPSRMRLAVVLVACGALARAVSADPGAAPSAPPAAPAEPFAFADFTWLTGNPRTKDSPLGNEIFTAEVRVDVDYVHDFNHPKDDTIVGSSEVFRSSEMQLT
jgi:hypothetical protein